MQNTREELPGRAGFDGYGSFRQRHTARYYMHRVQESLTTRVSKLVCAICLALLLIIGMVTFILWISLRPHRPRIHVRDFSIPGLAQANGLENARVVFNATTRNPNQSIGIYYDALQATLYYDDQSIGGTPLLFPFYQQPKNTTTLSGVLSGATLTVNNQRWMQFQSDRSQGTVIFRLDITSTIRFKVSTWSSKRHRLHAHCDVGVGPDGSIFASYRDRRCPVYFT
ncbi:NDR1/HIN1-like protein 26 [Diospyros lotus]|uniref:NDR1/HIN1-like protein 26 n=1 Tax=Diospyros lotus TaxID=55363 RepID=UPI002255B9D4|nr:NDR1/HIN1-like protein 26 [Diospyros lotus]